MAGGGDLRRGWGGGVHTNSFAMIMFFVCLWEQFTCI